MTDEFYDSFINEASELLDKIEARLFTLESNPDNTAAIQELFRYVHTIKGAASMFGFQEATDASHLLESVYDKVRNGELKTDKNLLNLSFVYVDVFRQNFRQNGTLDSTKYHQLIESLAAYSGQPDTTPSPEAGKTSEITHDGLPTLYFLFFTPEKKYITEG